MSIILQSQWKRQPQFSAKVDLDHPIFCGGKVEFLHSFTSFMDCAGNNYYLTPGSTVSTSYSKSGISVYGDNNTDNGGVIFNNIPKFASGENLTMFVRFFTATAETDSTILSLRASTPLIVIDQVSNNAHYSTRDDASSLSQSTTSIALNDGFEHTSALKRDAGNWWYSVDGAPWTKFSSNPTNGQGALNTMVASNSAYLRDATSTGNPSFRLAGGVLLGGLIRTGLTDSAIQALHNNPWQVFQPSQRILFAPSSGGGNVTVTATGNTGTFVSGILIPQITISGTGNAGTFAIGSLSPSSGNDVTVSATGNTGSFAVGSLVPSISVAATGQASTFAVGVLTPQLAFTLSGNAGSFAAGSLTQSQSISVTVNGNAASFVGGSLNTATTFGLFGNTGTFAAGTLTYVPAGDVTVSATGNAATFAAGQLQVLNPLPFMDFHDGEYKQKSKRQQKIQLRKDIQDAWDDVLDIHPELPLKEEVLSLVAKDFTQARALFAKYEHEKTMREIEMDDEVILLLL